MPQPRSPRLLKPRALRAGGTLGIAAPAGPVDPDKLQAGVALLRNAGFQVVHRPDIDDRRGYLAGSDARRAAELQELWRDDRVDAILCARGGYGCQRILDALDPELAREARKPLVGYSDVTALLLWQRRRAGLVGFHGPMLDYGDAIAPESLTALLAQLQGQGTLPVRLQGKGLVAGSARGRLAGGNLSLVTASLGTPWEISTRGTILVIEEVGERPYRIDRMLEQMRSAGKFEGLRGIAVGSLQGCTDDRYPEPGALQVIEAAARQAQLPCVVDLPFGHLAANTPWAQGVRATLDAEKGEVRILEQGVTHET